MKQDITCVFEGVAGVGGIYISNLKAAQNLTLLNSLGIKAIVTAVRNGVVQHDKQEINDHLYVPADDNQAFDLSKYFQETYKFIDNVRKKTNVLVHCYAGISRSATIVIAYLLRKYNYSLDKVISMVKRRRNKINPNKGFIEQLKQQATKMGIVSNDKDITVEEVLKKSNYSVQKKRAISSYAPTRLINQKLNQQQNSSKAQKYLNYTLKKQSNTSPIKHKYKVAPQQINQHEIPVNFKNKIIEQKKLEKSENLIQITDKNPSTYISTHSPQSISWNNKIVKIQRLKSKIVQSERRKKSNQKRSQSQLFSSQTIKNKQVADKKFETQNLYEILSKKLDFQKANKLQQIKKKSSVKYQKQTHVNKILFQQTSTLL